MKELIATYSVVTPMFLGDANQAAVGFRVPSFKGALRFWWRALIWSELADQPPADALRALHQREAKLFGLATSGRRGSQSRVLLSAETKLGNAIPSSRVVSPVRNPYGVNGLEYLKGQGLKRREAISSGRIEVHIRFLPGTSERERRSVECALMAFGLLGGLGSRARRGLGSCALLSLEGKRDLDLAPPQKLAELKPAIDKLLGGLSSNEPPYSAYSERMRVDLSLCGSRALDVLGRGGAQMALFRREIKADTQVASDVAKNRRPSGLPSRSSFGLPLQFFFKDSRTTVFFDPLGGEKKRNRRGSPLFLHVHELADEPEGKRFALIQTFLPAVFLPRSDEVIGKANRKVDGRYPHFQFPVPSLDQGVVNQYLDSFTRETGFQKLVAP